MRFNKHGEYGPICRAWPQNAHEGPLHSINYQLSTDPMTRKSKIARLPRSVRDELNRRLDNGQPGVRLVEWLNNLSDVKEVLAQDFHGCRITAQNVSKWKRGGYQDWLAQQECSA